MLVLGLAGAHVAAVASYLLPASPATVALDATLGWYVGAFWSQNWHLFSPNPPTSGETLLARCTTHDGVATPWIDTTAQGIADAFAEPWGPAPKLRYVHNGVHDQLMRRIRFTARVLCPEGETGDEVHLACADAHEAEIRGAVQASPEFAVAARFGRDACLPFVDDVDRVERLELRWVRTHDVPFSRRAELADPARATRRREYHDLPSVHFVAREVST